MIGESLNISSPSSPPRPPPISSGSPASDNAPSFSPDLGVLGVKALGDLTVWPYSPNIESAAVAGAAFAAACIRVRGQGWGCMGIGFVIKAAGAWSDVASMHIPPPTLLHHSTSGSR